MSASHDTLNPFSPSPSPPGSPPPPTPPPSDLPNPSASEPSSKPSPAAVGRPESPTRPSSLSTLSMASAASNASPASPPTHRPSFPDASREPKRGSSRLSAGPNVKTDFCCERDREIAKGGEVGIVDAYKTTEGGKGSYITYVIRLGTHETRRRYSAFLQLHQALTGLYPVLIIPPIPSKQSLADYAVKGQQKAKEDATVIARRRRLLEDFLKRLVRHPILGGEHVLHRFLEDGVSWSEVMHSPPISLLPKNPLHAPSHNPTFQGSPASPSSDPSDAGASPAATADRSASTSYIAHHLLPTPSPSHPLHRPDQRFLDSEVFTEKFEKHFTSQMEKVNRRVVKRWGERATDMNELGAVWNGFSLVEGGKLGEAIEGVGRAVDQEYLATAALLQAWEKCSTEPLHIYTQFASLIRQRLSFRHQKHVQYELVQEALETQKDKLELLEAAERESRRLEEALERGTSSRMLGGSVLTSGEERTPEELEAERERREEAAQTVRRAAGHKGGSGVGGLWGAVRHSLSGMMDVDPEATRRANIARTRDNIAQLEDSLQASAQDLKYASTTLQADLDRFQRQKVADLRQMAVQLSKVHREWCKQNLEAWQAAQAVIRHIEPHPNQPPSGSNEETTAAPALPPKLDPALTSLPSDPVFPVPASDRDPELDQRKHEGLPSPPKDDVPTDLEPRMGMTSMQREIDRVEAANKPLPLPDAEELNAPTPSSAKEGHGPL